MSDRDEANRCLTVSDKQGCEYSFANNLAWRRLDDTRICFHNGFYICVGQLDTEPCVFFPAGAKLDEEGKSRLKALLDELESFFKSRRQRFTLCSVYENELEWLKEVYGDRITYTYDRDSSDYIYKTTDLIEFKGKKFHGKRNHIKRFMETDWSFEQLTEDKIDECVFFTAEFYNRVGENYGSAAVEQFAIHTFLMNMKALGIQGGILRQNGGIVGISLGEPLNSDTYVVHIEKARNDLNGAYPTLCREFAKAYAADYEFINREEDMGREGLRTSKLSYHPRYLLNKYSVFID